MINSHMALNPYQNLPESSFWKNGVAKENPNNIKGIYRKKFDINQSEKIAIAGSCFAQHIGYHLRKNGYSVLDTELPPPGLPNHLRKDYGYMTYSARYGNIYTAAQLLQITKECCGNIQHDQISWERGGKYFDAFRPSVEPEGLDSDEEVIEHRAYHIKRVKKVIEDMDVFIFTLGLTEAWASSSTKIVYPSAPGVIAGTYSASEFQFINYNYQEIIDQLREFINIAKDIRHGNNFKIILTVSPVPLTASASRNHILVANSYSKSVLRAVAGYLCETIEYIDYFPSYEIITNPRLHSTAFTDNLRSVRKESVEVVMKHFFREHAPNASKFIPQNKSGDIYDRFLSEENLQCEEAILEEFGR